MSKKHVHFELPGKLSVYDRSKELFHSLIIGSMLNRTINQTNNPSMIWHYKYTIDPKSDLIKNDILQNKFNTTYNFRSYHGF